MSFPCRLRNGGRCCLGCVSSMLLCKKGGALDLWDGTFHTNSTSQTSGSVCGSYRCTWSIDHVPQHNVSSFTVAPSATHPPPTMCMCMYIRICAVHVDIRFVICCIAACKCPMCVPHVLSTATTTSCRPLMSSAQPPPPLVDPSCPQHSHHHLL